MATSAVSTLRQLAASGRCIVVSLKPLSYNAINVCMHCAFLTQTDQATLHQPSSQIFNQFDEVMLLAEGRILYFGDRLGSIEWFRRLGFECPKLANPADFLIKIVSMSESPESKMPKLKQISQWADLWSKQGDAFLQVIDNDRNINCQHTSFFYSMTSGMDRKRAI